MAAATAAMISAVAFAAATPTLHEWQDLSDLSAPAATFAMGQEKRSLADFKGRVVVLNLWATWCTPCLKELPALDALEEKYASDGLVVLPLSLDTIPFAQLQDYIAKLDLQLPHVAQDTNRDVSKTLMTTGLPITYLIDRKGVLRARYAGDADWLDKEHTARIEALLAEGEAR